MSIRRHAQIAFPRIADAEGRMARVASEAPRIPWDRFLRTVFRPVPGEHLAIIGPTGQGKTVLQNNILPLYPFVAVFATKPADRSMDMLINNGYVRLSKWASLNPIEYPRRVIWPKINSLRTAKSVQGEIFADAFEDIFMEGGRPAHNPVGWAVAIDELWYVTNILGLDLYVKMYLLQGRSLGHSLIVATQRPSKVPLEVYDQSTHLFFFRDNDSANLDRLSEIQARDSALVRHVVSNLEQYQALYINTRTGVMVRTRAPEPRKAVA